MVSELMRRRLLMTDGLPYDAEVEWLGSNSEAYIDTKIGGGDAALEITICAIYTKYVQYGAIYGNWLDDNHNATRLILNSSGAGLVATNSAVANVSLPLNSYFKAVITQNNFERNNISTPITTSQLISNNINIIIFNRSDVVPITRDIGCRIYSFMVEKNGVALGDFIPVRIGTTGYMYDKVSGRLFGNVGSGAFVLGEDKPQITGYEVLHDISNWDNGNGATINTLLVPSDSNWSFEGSWMRIGTPTQAYAAIISAYNSQAANSYRIILANNDASRAYVNACSKASAANTIAGLYQSIWYEYTLRYGSIIVNGSTTSLGTTQGTDLSANMYIASQVYPQRVGRFKAYHNNTLVADMIPCKRLSDNVCGMYDIVRHQFFTSSNQYNFTE